MKMAPLSCILLLSVLLIMMKLVVQTQAIGSNEVKDFSLYPVKNLEASLSASSSQASVVAVRCTNCVVVVSMSAQDQSCNLTLAELSSNKRVANPETSSPQHDDNDKNNDDDESGLIPVLFRGSICTKIRESRGIQVSKSNRIMHLLQETSGLTLFTTGFASDVQHLVRFAAAHVSEYEHIYGGNSMDAKGVMQDALAPKMASATMTGGSRPFGVQIMAISTTSPSFQIVTLDPSGNARYWYGVGAFIGKDSHRIKKYLLEILGDEKISAQSLPKSWRTALDICIRSLLKTAEESQNMIKTPKNEILAELDALVIFDHNLRNEKGYPCAIVDEKTIFRSFEKCYQLCSAGKS
jgi:20S proteasome alpha/beta subunit